MDETRIKEMQKMESDSHTRREIAERFSISPQRVTQILQEAVKKCFGIFNGTGCNSKTCLKDFTD